MFWFWNSGFVNKCCVMFIEISITLLSFSISITLLLFFFFGLWMNEPLNNFRERYISIFFRVMLTSHCLTQSNNNLPSHPIFYLLT
jgi:hypothetical protein